MLNEMKHLKRRFFGFASEPILERSEGMTTYQNLFHSVVVRCQIRFDNPAPDGLPNPSGAGFGNPDRAESEFI